MLNNKTFQNPINHQIRAREVLLIEDQGRREVTLNIALNSAHEQGLDLVQISQGNDGKPVCKIVDYGKFKYEMSKKSKEAAKKQRESTIKTKEIKFHPNTEPNDLQTKARLASSFIQEGDLVKVSVVFRGREIHHKEIAIDNLTKFLEMVENYQLLSEPGFQGKLMSVTIGKKKGK